MRGSVHTYLVITDLYRHRTRSHSSVMAIYAEGFTALLISYLPA